MKLDTKTIAIAAGVALAAWLFRDHLKKSINGLIWSGGL